ncbi:hypothetical protein BH23VER1_BH23VER1_00900 [soil metagenome]
MEYYNTTIAPATNIELIYVNLDSSENDMEKFMAEFKMPWPAIDFDKREKVKTAMDNDAKSVPNYVLLNAAGEVLATGPGPTKSKIGELVGGAQ